ncbi:MFS transporter [Paludisphaera borealis]|uniref:MFS transporter n=1 Tax=Paludisphaera borealis TaxID=1387353 RepID=UPI00143DFC21|nr:MFS transporter [Paludisphaera borealis]
MLIEDVGSTKSQRVLDQRRERLLLLMLASVQFTSIVDFMVVMPLGPQLMRSLEITPAQFGLIVSSYTIAAGIAGLMGSSVLDRFGRKTAFLSLFAGFVLGTLLCGLAWSYGTLLAARVVTGAFGGILGGMSLAIVGDVFPEERRGRATGILMSAFAVASVVGVPVGLWLGTKYGWQTPFLVLAALAVPIFFVALRTLPPLREHLHGAAHAHPLRKIAATFGHVGHLRAFALTTALMLGSFSMIPYISVYLVANAGVLEEQLPWVFVTGGALTLVGAPLIGRLADRFGKLPVYRIVATVSATLMLVVSNLGVVPLAVSVGLVGALMLSNAGRMVAALAMITGSVERSQRGGFMSANSAVQHLASGLGAYLGGLILVKQADGVLLHFGRVGILAVAFTALSIYLAGRVRPTRESARANKDSVHSMLDETTPEAA